MNPYDEHFYLDQQADSSKSAREIFRYLFKYIQPKTAIDIGCGVGTWLNALKKEYNATEVLGVDGDYVSREMLQIDASEFQPYDLKQYFRATKKYDIAISVEVGEHLPDSSADNLVKSLTDASDIVIFSAAIVNQEGTYHINEQYPEYWAAKFIAHGFTPIDCIRKAVWHNNNVDWWYRQNVLLYVKNEKVPGLHPDLQDCAAKTDPTFITRIHPVFFNAVHKKFKFLQSFEGFTRFKLYPVKLFFKGKSSS